MDSQLLQEPGGLVGKFLVEHAQDARSSLDQNDSGYTWIDVAKITRECEATHFPDRTGQFNARWPAADDHKRQLFLALFRIVGQFGFLETTQHTPADLGRLFDRFQSRSKRLPFLFAEIAVLGPARHHQIIVVRLTLISDDDATFGINRFNGAADDPHVLGTGKDTANGCGDFGRAQPRHRDLIQERLEQVMVPPIDQGDTHRSFICQSFSRRQSCETATHNHHVFLIHQALGKNEYPVNGYDRSACGWFRLVRALKNLLPSNRTTAMALWPVQEKSIKGNDL